MSGSATSPADLRGAYRADIDGLRAIAVGAVVVYHAFPTALTGGFVGVDIFFVISGYLISSIIAHDARDGRFGYLDFYGRRIKRIFPALMVVLLAVWAGAWILLFADEFAQLGRHVVAGAGFVSNFLLRGEAGYFDAAADTKPLLHLWSLAIEEQFYIVWPLVLSTLVIRLRARRTVAIVAAVAAASFLYNLTVSRQDATVAFYSPFSRVWELLLGALLAQATAHLTPTARLRDALAAIGLACLVVSIVVFSEALPYPGPYALLPTLGTVLVIGAGPRALSNRALLASAPMRWLGSISYPLYLWHWPLLSFAYIQEGRWIDPAHRGLLMLAAVALAWASDRWLERPIRASPSLRRLPATLAVAMVAVGALGFATFEAGGFPARMTERNDYVAAFSETLPVMRYRTDHDLVRRFREECNFYDFAAWRAGRATTAPRPAIDPTCYTRPSGAKHVVFLWGDSHAEHLNDGLRQALPADVALLQVASSACPANLIAPDDAAATACRRSNQFALEVIRREKPDVVVIAQRTNHAAERFERIAAELKRAGVGRVIVLGPVPQWQPDLHKTLARHFWNALPKRLDQYVDRDVQQVEQVLRQTLAGKPEPFVYIDLFDALCNTEGCMTSVDDDPREGLITFDYGHLTPRASEWLARTVLAPAIMQGLTETAPPQPPTPTGHP